MGKSPCCEKLGLKKGPWTPEEDQKLLAYIEQHGHGSWRALPAKAGLQRCGKSCRLRWTNYLRPDIKRGKFSLQEEQTIIQLHALLGNRWSAIATHLPKRTDNEIKNYWNTHLKKRLTKMGIDPLTHKPRTDGLGSGQSKNVANLSHMAQWETARLEAEARLVRESKQLQGSNTTLLMTTNQQQQQHACEASRFIITNKLPALSQQSAPVPPCLDVLKAWQGSWPSTPCSSKKSGTGVNGIYSMLFATDDLQSPTSTLSFSDNMLAVPSGNINFGLINRGSLFSGSTTINTTHTAATAVSVEGAAGGKTGNGTDAIMQERHDDQHHQNESWSTKANNMNNDNNDAVIVDSNDLLNMAAYSVQGSSWFVEAAVNETTVAVDDPDDHNVASTDFQIDAIEAANAAAVAGPGEILHFDGRDDMLAYNDDNFGNDQQSLGSINVNCYWNSILNLVNASSSSVF